VGSLAYRNLGAAEPKLGTGVQLEPDPEPELTPKRIAYNFWF